MRSPVRRRRSSIDEPAVEAERLVAWLRLLAVAIIGIGEWAANPSAEEAGFLEAALAFSFWSLLLLVLAHSRPVTRLFTVVGIVGDVAAITALVVLSGGAFSPIRLAYFFIPIAVAFRFKPRATAAAAAFTVAAYVVQALLDPAFDRPTADEFTAIQAGYLTWVGAAAVLLSRVLARRTRAVEALEASRRQLLADALAAGERERKGLSEGLHDHAIQNLLSVRHEIQEAAEAAEHPALARADVAIASTLNELREAIFELHPYVLEEAGLAAALRAVAERAGRRGGFDVHFDIDHSNRHEQDELVLVVARELLANAVAHAGAENVWLRLHRSERGLELAIRDDGRGFDPTVDRVAEGHIGLASQRERVATAGGRLEVDSSVGEGTTVVLRLPS